MTDTEHANAAQRYAFAGHRLDAAARSLTHSGEAVAIPPKSLDCLIYLIEHRSRAVGRDELISAVWGRVDLSYAVLAQTLWKLRRALGETHGADSRFIRTVPRFGYQWVASVDLPQETPATLEPALPSEIAGAALSVAETQRVGEPLRRRSRMIAAAGVGLILVIAALAALALFWRQSHAPPNANDAASTTQGGAKRFLVLPVAIDAGRGEDAWIRLGVMDYIATQLRANDKAQVIGSDRVVMLLGERPAFDANDASQLAHLKRVSGASYVVVPTARRTGTGWKFSLSMHSGEADRLIETTAASPLAAANEAVGEILRSAGLEAAPAVTAPNQLTELLQRIDAASLAGNYAQALDIARSADEQQKSDAQLQLKVAQIAFRAGHIDDAAAGFQALADSATRLPGTVQASARIGLAAIAERRQRYGDAEREYSDVIDALGEHGDPVLLSQAYTMRGLVDSYVGHADEGRADFARARVAFARSGDEAGLAGLDATTGLAERALGHYREAAEAFDRSIVVFERFGMRDRVATAMIGAIGTRLEMLDIPRALALSRRAEDLAATIESPVLINYLALVRGETLLADGQLAELAAFLEKLGAAADPSAPGSVPDLLLLRVSLALAENKPDMTRRRAESLLERIEHPAEPTYRTSLGGAIMTLADSALRSGDAALAGDLLDHLRKAGEADVDRLRPLALQLVQAQVLSARNDAAAVRYFAAALAEVDRTNYPDALVSVCLAWTRHLQDNPDRPTMTMVAGRLQPFIARDFRAARAAAVLYSALGEQDLAKTATAAAQALAHERSLTAPL